MGKFVITKRKNGEYQFNLKAGNGQVIPASEGYTTKAACHNGIESVKKNSQVDDRFDRKVSGNGNPISISRLPMARLLAPVKCMKVKLPGTMELHP